MENETLKNIQLNRQIQTILYHEIFPEKKP